MSPRPSKRESLVDNFYIVYLRKKLSSGGLYLFSDSKEIHQGISSFQFRTVRQREKTCVMERDFLKAPIKHRKSLRVSTFKFSTFETANTKFNISQLKANNFPKYSQPLSYSALSPFSKESLLELLIKVKLLRSV